MEEEEVKGILKSMEFTKIGEFYFIQRVPINFSKWIEYMIIFTKKKSQVDQHDQCK